ncbi:MAG: hypothetical protein IJD04_08805 [Desulfovibrionaceae bacterium]|nr:hypothetical protein [Desulfovibrionaceae bacterium]
MFFRLPRRRSQQPRSAWRSFLLILVFCGTAWAFWQNSQNQLDRLTVNQNIWDDPPCLSERERKALQEMTEQFKARYGIDVRMEILNIPLHAPVGNAAQIYIGINPKTSDFLLKYPAWLRLEPDFSAQVNAAHIQPRLAEQQYAYALADALRAIWEELKTQEKEQDAAGNPTESSN